MTKQKTFKRRVRTRMEKTSESYTAARRRLLAQSERQVEPEPAPGPETTAGNSGTGVSENRVSGEVVTGKTGRDWDSWFTLLDKWGAQERKHSEIAGWLTGEHGVAGWWAQSITVAYERARGLRVPGQGRDGAYSVSASKTVNVPVEMLFRAVGDAEMRSRWLPQDLLGVTTSSPHKSTRGRWDGGDGRVAIEFVAKADGKSQIALAHEKLPDPESARRMKAYWAERLNELKRLLEG